MHRFHYRYPRFPTDFSAQFVTSGETIPCRCIEVSVTGMKVEFAIPLATGSRGRLSFHYQNREIELNTRVAHATSLHSGLEFLGDEDPAQGAIGDLVDSLSVTRDHCVMMLVPRSRSLHTQR